MTIESFDVGFVSATDALVHFYADVLELPGLEPRVFPMGTVHRLQCGPGVLKVMVPNDQPAPLPPTTSFWERSGIRYATMWVDDVRAVVDRWRVHGGIVVMEPFELRAGVTTALVVDPDGNTVEVMCDASPR